MKRTTQITIVLAIPVIISATLRAVDPPPAVNQELADRHHVFYGSVIPELTDAPFGTPGELYACISCHEEGTDPDGNVVFIVVRDCRACHGVNDTMVDRHHRLTGEEISNPTDAPFGVPGEVYACITCHEVDTSSGSNEFIVERNCLACQGAGNQPPVADAGGPYEDVVGQPVSFDATASNDPDGSIVYYDWDFGDGTVVMDAGPNPFHTYAAGGDYDVTLTVTDDGDLTDTGVANVSIEQQIPIDLDLDIARFRVSPLTVNIAKPKPFKITFWVENPGLVDGECMATIVGDQEGNSVFNETFAVSAPPLSGREKLEFSYLPTQVGEILWSVWIDDGDPDVDSAEATTTVHDISK